MSCRIIIKGPVVSFWRGVFSDQCHVVKPNHRWGEDDYDDPVNDSMNALAETAERDLLILDDAELAAVDDSGSKKVLSIDSCCLELCGIIQTRCDCDCAPDVLFGQQEYANGLFAIVNEKDVSPECLTLRYRLLYHPQRGWLRILACDACKYMFTKLNFELEGSGGKCDDTFWIVEGRRYMMSKGVDATVIDAMDIADDAIDLHPQRENKL